MYAVYKWHRSAEEISIRTNGANRKASLTNGDFFTNGSIGEGFLTIGICLCILVSDMNLADYLLTQRILERYYKTFVSRKRVASFQDFVPDDLEITLTVEGSC